MTVGSSGVPPQNFGGTGRRPSKPYKAIKAVDDLARKLSMPDFSLHDVEDHLERELERDAVQPDTTTAVLRDSVAKILHSKKVLLMVVILNVIDCGLVLGELMLDIHFVKEMVEKTKILTVRFATILTENFALYFGDLGHQDIDIFYNRILSVMYRSVYTNDTHDIANGTAVSNYTIHGPDPFVRENVPRFLQGASTEHSSEEKVAYAFHKASIAILGVLTLMVLLKIFCYGPRLFRKKLELLDGVVVISSFVVDLVYIQGMMAYPLEEAVQILAFLVPWRVLRVANSFVIAVMDRAHLKLKMEYKQKKKVQKKLEFSVEKNLYYKNIIHELRDMCLAENIPQSTISECVLSIDPPKQRKSTTNFQKLKKSLQFQCIKRNGSGKYSTPSIYRAVEDEAGLYPTKDSVSPALDVKSLKSALSNCSRLSKSPDQHRRHHVNLSPPSHHSIYFQLGSDQSDENSDDNDDDGDLGFELLGFCHDEEGHDNENNHINTNLP